MQYELIAIGIATPLLLRGKSRKFIAIAILVVYLLTLPIQVPVFPSGNLNPPGSEFPVYSYALISQMKVPLTEVAKVAHSTILITDAGGLSRADLLSVLAGVSPSKIIDQFDPDIFAKASLRPWVYADYVVISKDQPLSYTLLQQRYWGAYFNHLYYTDPDWRARFEAHFRKVFETNGFILFERVGT